MASVGKKMAKGVRWSALEKSGQQGITFIVFAVLARFVAPEDFGLVAMALVIIGFVQIFVDQGFSTAIIQREDIDDVFLSTAFWVNIAVGIFMGLILIILKDLPSWFFNEPRVAELIPWMALALLFEALMAVPQALLKRNFDFKGLALRTIWARLIAGGVAIGGAVAGWGVWSLVVFTVLSNALSTMILWWVSDWYPRIHFSSRCFKDLLHFGGNVTGVRIMSYIQSRILDVIIGFFFGAVVLGYFTLAYQLVSRMAAVMVQLLSQVTMSGFSRVQSSREVLRSHLLKVIRLTTSMVLPLFAFVGLVSNELVILLYGEGWEESARIITHLAPIGPIMIIVSSLGDVVMSAGRPSLIFKVRLVTTLAICMLLLLLSKYGVDILVITFTASFYILVLPLYIVAANKVINFKVQDLIIQVSPAIIAAMLMTATIYLLRSLYDVVDGVLVSVLLQTFIGFLVYIISLAIIDMKCLYDLRKLILSR